MTVPRVGVLLPTFDPTDSGKRPPVVTGARLIEEAGFDGAWVGDHLACPAPLLDAVSCLAAAAAVTDRIALGFSILLLGLRPPAWTAKQLQTLDALAPGRTRLGVGVGGEFPEEFTAAGVPLSKRGRRVDETLKILPDLLNGKPVHYEGTQIDVHVSGPGNPDRGLVPAVSTLPPIYIAGRGEPALRRTATYGDFWMPMWLSPGSVARRVATLAELADAAHRPTPRVAALILAHVDPDPATARREADAHLRHQYGMGLERVEHWTALGTAAQITEQVAEFVAVGVEEFILMPLGSDALTQIERLAEVKAGLDSTTTSQGASCVYS